VGKKTNAKATEHNDATKAGGLLKQQRELESNIWYYNTSILLLVLLTILAGFLWLRPIESSSNTSPSNIVRGGVSRTSTVIPPDSESESLQSVLFSYLGISADDLNDLELSEINLNDDDYTVFTRRATGNQPETVHSHTGRTFYDSPLDQLQPRNNQPIEALVGQLSEGLAGTNSGIDGGWFAILPGSGNVVIRKTNANTVDVRLLPDASSLSRNQIVRYGLAITSPKSGSTARVESLSIDLPEQLQLTEVISVDQPLTISVDGNNITLVDAATLGGNRHYWIEFDALVASAETLSCLTADIKLNGLPISSTSPESCLAINQPQNTDATGLSVELDSLATDNDNFIRQRVKINRDDDDGGNLVIISATQKNYARQTTTTDMVVELADALEYSNLQTDNASLDPATQKLNWPLVELLPGQQVTNQVKLELDQPLANTPVASSDAQSFDLALQVQLGASVTELQLEQSYIKNLEQTILQLPVVTTLANAVLLLVILLLTELLLIRQLRAVYDAKAARRDIHGGLKHEVHWLEHSPRLMKFFDNNRLVTFLGWIQIVLRPQTLAWASSVAAVGMAILVFQARSIGLELSGSEVWLLLIGGWVFGLILEQVHKKISS